MDNDDNVKVNHKVWSVAEQWILNHGVDKCKKQHLNYICTYKRDHREYHKIVNKE